MANSSITVQNLSKVYSIWSQPHARLTGTLARRWQAASWLPPGARALAGRYYTSVCREFHALRDISFEVPKGETVGIIGRNGSGKSTTLKIIAGTLRPTGGVARVDGRVAALLELGSGFNPEFTGRENVYLSAAILGMSRDDIESRFDAITAFANIGDFIEQPVKTYSSGMMLRLAFAVHTAVDPEILIVDEALSVGDEGFRRKCFARLERLRDAGTTILFVSHDMGSILNLTSYALFFNRGEIVLRGSPKDVVRGYEQYMHAKPDEAENVLLRLKEQGRVTAASAPAPKSPPEGREVVELVAQEVTDPVAEDAKDPVVEEGYEPDLKSQSRHPYDPNGARIERAEIVNEAGEVVNRLVRGRRYRYRYQVVFEERGRNVSFAMLIKTYKGMELGGARSQPINRSHASFEAGEVYQVEFAFDCRLTPGVYFLNAGVEGDVQERRTYLHRVIDAAVFRVCHEAELIPTGVIDFHIVPSCHKLEAVAS